MIRVTAVEDLEVVVAAAAAEVAAVVMEAAGRGATHPDPEPTTGWSLKTCRPGLPGRI